MNKQEQVKGRTNIIWKDAPEDEGIRLNGRGSLFFREVNKTHYEFFDFDRPDYGWELSSITSADFLEMQPRPQQITIGKKQEDDSHIAMFFAEDNPNLSPEEVKLFKESFNGPLDELEKDIDIKCSGTSSVEPDFTIGSEEDRIAWKGQYSTDTKLQQRGLNEVLSEAINKGFTVTTKTGTGEASDSLLEGNGITFVTEKEPPIFTKEMQDNGELPKVGMLYINHKEIECKSIGDDGFFQVGIPTLKVNDSISVSRKDNCKPIDTRSDKKSSVWVGSPKGKNVRWSELNRYFYNKEGEELFYYHTSLGWLLSESSRLKHEEYNKMQERPTQPNKAEIKDNSVFTKEMQDNGEKIKRGMKFVHRDGGIKKVLSVCSTSDGRDWILYEYNKTVYTDSYTEISSCSLNDIMVNPVGTTNNKEIMINAIVRTFEAEMSWHGAAAKLVESNLFDIKYTGNENE